MLLLQVYFPQKSQKNENLLPKKSLVGINVSIFGEFCILVIEKN